VSVEAISWVLRQPIGQSSAKFVLVAIANCADGQDFVAWPSISYLVEATSQDRKTVIANIKKLVEMGYLEDTGERAGATKQIVVYRMKSPENGTISNGSENGTVKEAQKRNSTENGTVPKFPTKSTVFPQKEYRFSLERVPKTGHGTVRNHKEPLNNKKVAARFDPMSRLTSAGVPSDVAQDWLELRKQKKASVTETAISRIEREAEKANIPLSEALAVSCMRGWTGFKASWYTKDAGNTATGKRRLVL